MFPHRRHCLLFLIGTLVAGGLSPSAWAEMDEVAAIRAEARKLSEAGQAEAALEKLNEAAVKYPGELGLFTDLGENHLARGAFDAAAAAFGKALEIEPAQPLVQYNRAYCLRLSGRLDEAVQAYRVYLEINPKDPDAWFGLAQSHEDQGAGLDAAKAYETYAATETRPEQSPWIEKAQQRAAELRAAFVPTSGAPVAAPAPVVEEPAANSGPAPAVAPSYARGAAFQTAVEALQGGRYDEALRFLEDVPVEAKETDFAVLAARAGAHLGRYQAKEAVGLYRRALTSAPESAVPGLLLGLAEALRVTGERQEARTRLDEALAHPSISPSLADAVQARRGSI